MTVPDRTGTWWCSENVPSGDRTDAWRLTLNECYRTWQVPRRLDETFLARVRQREIGTMRLVECLVAPCSGHRLTPQLRQDEEPYIGIQIVLDGAEKFRVGQETLSVKGGSLLVWDSAQPMEF